MAPGKTKTSAARWGKDAGLEPSNKNAAHGIGRSVLWIVQDLELELKLESCEDSASLLTSVSAAVAKTFASKVHDSNVDLAPAKMLSTPNNIGFIPNEMLSGVLCMIKHTHAIMWAFGPPTKPMQTTMKISIVVQT